MKTYSEKLKDPRWQKKRLEIFARDEFKCRHCGNDKLSLNLHHIYYERDIENPWEYPNELLTTLCCECHEYESSQLDFNELSKSFLKDILRIYNIPLLEIDSLFISAYQIESGKNYDKNFKKLLKKILK